MAVVVQRLIDRSMQEQIEYLETEYFRWVNAELGAEFGIGLDVDAMISRDLNELEIYLPPRGALFVALDGDDLVGMIFLTPIRDDTAQIRRMYVRASHRRQGLGGTLFDAAVQAARNIGHARVLLESPRSWAGAHDVYRTHGFDVVPVYPESEVPEHLRQYWIFMGLDLAAPHDQLTRETSGSAPG